MFHVVTCDKRPRQTIRIVNADDVEAVMNRDMGECLLCGPCSHFELGPRKDYWTVHSSHVTEDEATKAAWTRALEDMDRYDMSFLFPAESA